VIPSQTTSPPTLPQDAKRLSIRPSRSAQAVEYEIWRRWEDCLDFQRTLEVEYLAVSKRRRKGEPALNHHAKDMLYPSQRAASFESLPLGPDPSTIPVDVHSHIPKLSKKTTLFRMNESVIQQRGEEFKAMMEALFDEDAPSTLQELRTVSTVREFFGYWRRDKEAERKMGRVPTLSSAIPLPSHQGKSGDSSKQSHVLTPELIAFATGGSLVKQKHPPTGRPAQTTPNGPREVQRAVLNPTRELGRATAPAPAFALGVPPHLPLSVSAASRNGERQRRRSPPSRPVEGTIRGEPSLPHSPALVNDQSKMPTLDSPGSPTPYTNSPILPYGDGFSRLRQSSSPQIHNLLSVESNSSFPSQYSPPVGSVFNYSVPFVHPMQGRTVSMPAQRRHRDGQISPSTNQVLPAPIPRRRTGAVDMSGNRGARFFDTSTDVVNGLPLKSPDYQGGEGGTHPNTGRLQGPSWQSSRSPAERTTSGRLLASLPPSQVESRQSYGGSDASIPSPTRTLFSTGYLTSVTTSQSSQRSSVAAQRHRTAPCWNSKRMSLDSLASIDLELYSHIGAPPSFQPSPHRTGHLDGNEEKDQSRLYVAQGPNPRHSVSSDSSHTDGGFSDSARAPSASMPSLIPPSKIQPSSAQPPSPPPPRPPRSPLRPSSMFSSGQRTSIGSSPAASLLTPAEDGGAAMPVDNELAKRASTNQDDVVDSYFETPSSAPSEDPFELEFRPQAPLTPAHHSRGRENSAGTNLSMSCIVPPLPSFLPPESVTPLASSEIKPVSPTTPIVGATTTIKAVHEASNTILLFRVSRTSTSLADLRAKLSRKFKEAENIQLNPEQLELRYLASASAAPNMANRPLPARGAGSIGRKRSASVNSIYGADGLWLPLNTEADWHVAAGAPNGKVTVKVF
jgi:hypothetical protein